MPRLCLAAAGLRPEPSLREPKGNCWWEEHLPLHAAASPLDLGSALPGPSQAEKAIFFPHASCHAQAYSSQKTPHLVLSALHAVVQGWNTLGTAIADLFQQLSLQGQALRLEIAARLPTHTPGGLAEDGEDKGHMSYKKLDPRSTQLVTNPYISCELQARCPGPARAKDLGPGSRCYSDP